MHKLFTFNIDEVGHGAPSSQTRETATDGEHQPQIATDNTLMQKRKSELSQKSLVAKYMALDPNVHDAFEERAAILQFDAGLSCAEAERQAFIEVMQAFRDD